MNILKLILVVFEVVVLFNVLIIVHELGHFLAARWRGLVVDKFGVWFGRPLWKKTIGGVEYSLGTIPAGGFVSLPQMAPMETIEGKSEKPAQPLPPCTPLDKIIVALAGPLFSFALAVFFSVLVWWVGRPVSESDATTIIGYVIKDTDAARKGLRAGDRILSVDGKPVTKFEGAGPSVKWRVIASEGKVIPIEVEREGQILRFEVEPEKDDKASWTHRSTLRELPILAKFTPMVARLMPYSPAELGGVKKNDIFTHCNGEPIYSSAQVADIIHRGKGEPVTFRLLREGKSMELTLTPALPEKHADYMIGVVWDLPGPMQIIHPTPVEQIKLSVSSIIDMFSALASPKSDIKVQHLSGPVGILRVYYQLFESSYGWQLALWFSVIVNVNLAVMNLLPIPVLDGGHITLAIIEWIRRRPINVQFLEFLQTACAMAIIGFIFYVSFYDILDQVKPVSSKTEEIRFTPPIR